MNAKLGELVTKICAEKDVEKKLALVKELREVLDKESQALRAKSSRKPAC